jgi:GxxExxY protein
MSHSGLKHRELTQKIIGVFFEVYNELGHGFLESVYETAFEVALVSKGMSVFRQIEVPVWFRGRKIGDFTADMLVEKSVLLELKAGRSIRRTKHNSSITSALQKLKWACYSVLDSSLNLSASLMTTSANKEDYVRAC